MIVEKSNGKVPANERQRRFNWPRIFGYDFFISFKLGHPPIGTQSYASDLARRLREQDFTVFFSEEEAPPGAKLDTTLVNALHRSRILVVVANEGALLQSQWVRQEVEEFRRKHPKRPVIPINVEHALEAHGDRVDAKKWLDHEGRIWLDETRAAIDEGIVGSGILQRLLLIPKFLRANVLFRLLVILIMAVLAGLGAYAWAKKNESRDRYVTYNVSQGRAALTSGRALEAAPSLLRAYKEGVDTPELKFMLAQSFASLDALIASFDGNATAFSADGTRFAAALSDGTVQIWNLEDRKLAVILRDKVPRARTLVFSPDGNNLAIAVGAGPADESPGQVRNCPMGAGGSRMVLTYWDARSGELLKTLEPLEYLEDCWQPFFSEGGRTLALANWTTSTADLYWSVTKFDTASFTAISSTKPDDAWKCREVARNEVLKKLDQEGGSGGCPGNLAAISADGELIAFAPWDIPQRELSLWNVRQGGGSVLPFQRDTEVIGARFSLDNEWIAATLAEGVEVWNARSQRKSRLIPLDTPAIPAEFSPDGSRLVALSGQRSAAVFHAESGQRLAQIEGHAARIRVAKFSPDSDQIVTAGDDGVAKVWDSWTGKLLLNLEGHRKPVIKAAFSPDLNFIVTEDQDRHIKIWRGRPPLKPRILRDDPRWLKWGTGDTYSLADFSLDGRKVLIEQNDVWSEAGNVFSLWDSETGVLISRVKASSPPSLRPRMARAEQPNPCQSPNSQSSDETLASGNNSGIALARNEIAPNLAFLQQPLEGCRKITLEGHKSSIISAAFSENDHFAFTVDADGTMMAWNTQNGYPTARLAVPEKPVGVSYLPGEKLITLHGHNFAQIWAMPEERRGFEELERIVSCSGLYTPDQLVGLAVMDIRSCPHGIHLPQSDKPGAAVETANALFATAWANRNDRRRAEPGLRAAGSLYEKNRDLLGKANCHLALRAIAAASGDAGESDKEAEVVREIISALVSTEGQQARLRRLGELAFNEFGDNELARYAYEQALVHDPQDPDAKLGLWETSLPVSRAKDWLGKIPVELASASMSERARVFEWMALVLSGQKNDDAAYEVWSIYMGDTRNPISERFDFRGIRRELDKSVFSAPRKNQVIHALELLETPGDQGNKLKILLGIKLDRGLVGP